MDDLDEEKCFTQNMNISRRKLFSIQVFKVMGQRMILTDIVE